MNKAQRILIKEKIISIKRNIGLYGREVQRCDKGKEDAEKVVKDLKEKIKELEAGK